MTMREKNRSGSPSSPAKSLLVLAMAAAVVCSPGVAAFCPPGTARARPSAAMPSMATAATTNQRQRPSIKTAGGALRAVSLSSSAIDDGSNQPPPPSPRSKLRQITGFSLTAVRSTLRAATGFSLTATRAALRAATGISLSGAISGFMSAILGILTPGMRYFLQPLLVLYYVPLLTVRYWLVGPSGKYVEESRRGHERVVEGWRRAVEAAESASEGGYWPVHLNEDGTITTSLPPDPNEILDLTDGIEKSVAMAVTATAPSDDSSNA